MAGPLMAVGRALLSSELAQPVINKLVSSGALDPNVGRLLYGQSLGSTLTQAAEPIGRMLGLLPEEPPNYNLPTDYYVSPQGQVLSSEGERMVTGQGMSGFQPENQYGSRGFEEPRYEPPMPWNYSMRDAGEIPSQIPMGTPAQEFPSWSLPRVGMPDLAEGLPAAVPQAFYGGGSEGPYGSDPYQQTQVNPAEYQQLAGPAAMPDLAAAVSSATPYESVEQELERLRAKYADQPTQKGEGEYQGGGLWWPQAPQIDPQFLEQQQSQER